MTLNRLIVAFIAFGLAPALGSCAQVSSTVADTWPHWAGGEPAGTPPRRGSAGYDEFVTHGKTQSNAANPAAAGDQTNSQSTAAPQAYASQRPAPSAPGQVYAPQRSAPAAPDEPPADPPVTRGGLY